MNDNYCTGIQIIPLLIVFTERPADVKMRIYPDVWLSTESYIVINMMMSEGLDRVGDRVIRGENGLIFTSQRHPPVFSTDD